MLSCYMAGIRDFIVRWKLIMDSKLQKWIRWFEVIKKEVTQLLRKRNIFWEVNEIIKNNKKIQQPSSFYNYLGDTYVAYALIGIRRQVKIDNTSISLTRLLSEIINNPEKISRKYYKHFYKGSLVEFKADKDFDKYSGKGKNHISKNMVHKDLELLKATAFKCEKYADRRVAHTDKRKLRVLPLFRDVDKCIDVLDKLCVKYHGIFHAAYMETLMPVYQYNWKEIFRYPWLKNN